MKLSQELLVPILEYEVANSKRSGRYISLVRTDRNIDNVPVRESDAVFPDGTILLGETDKSGAMVFLERISVLWGESNLPRAAVVTFPFDGFNTAELLSELEMRLARAKASVVNGTIITQFPPGQGVGV